MKYIILLNPVTKKNSQRILRNRKTGKPFPAPSEQFLAYQQNAGWFLKPPPQAPIDYPVNVKCLFYMKTHGEVDLNNLLESATDILKHYQIIKDDNSKIVAAHDGSRVLYDKENPRTCIEIDRIEV